MKDRIVFLSPPGAAAYMGSGWWMELIRQLRLLEMKQKHRVDFIDILDCGHQVGRAVTALGAGQTHLVLAATAPQYRAVTLLARSLGAVIYPDRPVARPTFHLGNRRGL